jgi:UDP-N-acetyl-D-mannosaminuronic acid transferase (WecB/TagA/CpsF family)
VPYFSHVTFTGERSGKKRWLYPIGSPSQRKWVRKHIRQVNQRAHRTAGVLSILGGREEVVAAAAAAVEEQVEKERLHLRSETPGVFQTHEAGPKEMEGKGEESGQGQDVDPLV